MQKALLRQEWAYSVIEQFPHLGWPLANPPASAERDLPDSTSVDPFFFCPVLLDNCAYWSITKLTSGVRNLRFWVERYRTDIIFHFSCLIIQIIDSHCEVTRICFS